MVKHFPSNIKKSRGFSLMEVLVTVVVLSIGLLGLAGLQMTGMKNNHSAYLRSQATILANDIVDRMRSNRNSALTGAYDTALGTLATAPVTSCDGDATDNCTEADMATLDLNQWKNTLANILPSGDGSIARTVAGNQTTATIIIQWDDTRGQGAATQFSIETLL